MTLEERAEKIAKTLLIEARYKVIDYLSDQIREAEKEAVKYHAAHSKNRCMSCYQAGRTSMLEEIHSRDDAFAMGYKTALEEAAKVADEHCECTYHGCLPDVVADEIRAIAGEGK